MGLPDINIAIIQVQENLNEGPECNRCISLYTPDLHRFDLFQRLILLFLVFLVYWTVWALFHEIFPVFLLLGG